MIARLDGVARRAGRAGPLARRHARGAGRRALAEAGFTLLEILIAMVILMVGLCGIMAVFPHAMKSANSTVEKSYAAAISQSVIDAILLGLREMRTPYEDWQAFVLEHDGVNDLEQDRDGFLRTLNLSDLKDTGGGLKPEFRALLRKDYCVLLPRANELEGGGGGRTPIGRAYVYPRANPGDNEARTPARRVSAEGIDKLELTRVFQLGRHLRDSQHPDEVMRELERADPWQQFGFAFTVRATKGPTAENPTPDRNMQPIVPGLYEVVVSVHRNFIPNPASRYYDPVERFTAYIGAR